MKKLMVMLLALVMVFSLAACGSGGGTGESSDQTYELKVNWGKMTAAIL